MKNSRKVQFARNLAPVMENKFNTAYYDDNYEDDSFSPGSEPMRDSQLQVDEMEPMEQKNPTETDYCSALTRNQSASGEWKDISELIRKITKDDKEENMLSAFAIAYLEKKCAKSYKLVASKGRKYLISKYGENEALKLINEAIKLLN